MIKYINRDALVHTLLDKGFYPVIVRNAIEATTVTDVAPIIHAHWIRDDETQIPLGVDWYCSLCGQIIHVDGILTAIGAGWYYCPKCGTKMEGIENV